MRTQRRLESAETAVTVSNVETRGQTLYSVTDEAVGPSSEPSRRRRQYARGVLRAVQGLPEGTEATVSFTMDGKTFRRAAGTAGQMQVRVQDLAAPYISLHNHASNGILSPEDVFTLLRYDRMRGIGAVGNNGALFTCEKVFGYNKKNATDWFDILKRKYPLYRDSSQIEEALKQRFLFAEELRKDGVKYGIVG